MYLFTISPVLSGEQLSEMKKKCTPKVYDFIMKACEEYKKDFKNFISKISV